VGPLSKRNCKSFVTNILAEIHRFKEMVVVAFGSPFHQMWTQPVLTRVVKTSLFVLTKREYVPGSMLLLSANVMAFEFHVVLGHSFG
jgi:hypothetical protein